MFVVEFGIDPFVHSKGTLAIPNYINKHDIDAINEYIKSNIELADLEDISMSYDDADIYDIEIIDEGD